MPRPPATGTMRLIDITLPVSDPVRAAAYFREVLQLPVRGGEVSVGWTLLRLVPAEGQRVGGVHLAFNVPDNRFADAMSWLRERSPLQCSPDGKDYFALESSWQSQSVYFTGPDGLILELIGRRRLPASSRTGGFNGGELTCISEVGLPSTDVEATHGVFARRFGLSPLSEPSEAFVPMGDDEGLLIVVDAARHWFPEQVDLPNARGIAVVLEQVGEPQSVVDEVQGWRVSSR